MDTNVTARQPGLRLTPVAPIRVGFVLHVMQVAGAEVLVAEIIRRLGPSITPVVLCLDGVGQLGEQMMKEGVPVVALGRRPGLDFSVARRMASEINARRLEVVHAHQYTPFFYSALARPFVSGRIHLIFTEHGRHYPDHVSSKRRLINRWILGRFADDITAVCGFSAKSLREVDGFSNRSIEIIPNGIDLPHGSSATDRAAVRVRLNLNGARRYIVCVARLHPVKDHETLLRAFALVAAAKSDVDLLLAGDGPERTALERLAARLGVASRIHFLGIRHDVAQLLEAADIFAMSSLSEAASLTLLEAMGAGRPVVVTRVGGNPEIVTDGEHGFLAVRGNPESFASAMTILLDDPDLARAMGEAGRRRAADEFQLSSTVSSYQDCYMRAVARLRSQRPESAATSAAPNPGVSRQGARG